MFAFGCNVLFGKPFSYFVAREGHWPPVGKRSVASFFGFITGLRIIFPRFPYVGDDSFVCARMRPDGLSTVTREHWGTERGEGGGVGEW